jgi:hypothetical protein
VRVRKYLGIREPKHAIPATLDPLLPLCIGQFAMRGIMRAAVDLNNQSRTVTQEVRNERAERRLPAKVRSLQRQATKLNPQRALGVCHQTPQSTRDDNCPLRLEMRG